MSRRGENIRKRKDGRWEGRYIKGYDSKKQKARYASVYGKTYAETKQKLDEAKYKSSIGVVYVDAKNKLFGEIINSWFNAKKINLKPSSIIKYQNLIEKHILPELGHRKLRELNADLFYTFLDAQQKNGNKKNGGMLSTSSLQTMLYMRSKEPCHYSQEKKYIAMHDEMTDAEYADVIQHELGHFIDDILGRPSTGNVFRQAFSDVASRYNVDTLEGRRLLNDMLDDAFSTGAAFDRNITDIISALTMNHPTVVNRFNDEDVAYYRHKDGYWNRRNENGTNAGMREKDSFANVFAIETGNYRISTNFVERWFPELSIALRQSVEGA